VTIEPRSSPYQRRQIKHLAPDGVLAKDKPLVFPLRPSVLNPDGLSVYVPALSQPLPKCIMVRRGYGRRVWIEDAYQRHFPRQRLDGEGASVRATASPIRRMPLA
jgi:hypothetical protein